MRKDCFNTLGPGPRMGFEYPPIALVIGGTGFIGSHLVRELVRQGFRVRVLSRGAVPSTDGPTECIRGSLTDSNVLRDAISGSSVVFHVAGGGGRSWEEFNHDVVLGTLNLATACLRHGRPRLIYASSIAALYLGLSLIHI